ncbi:hypothetical protein EV421DRAFT_1744272 [Armillaria borealis]|uniref:Uncharacterized protein n=1 Tax=Armillaria borealis TaxID=47425 RepID=A0AA39IV21_9AGAR|nr:hypothetical protein EV421DRAFT_1744272 [Armillaria borealis]
MVRDNKRSQRNFAVIGDSDEKNVSGILFQRLCLPMDILPSQDLSIAYLTRGSIGHASDRNLQWISRYALVLVFSTKDYGCGVARNLHFFFEEVWAWDGAVLLLLEPHLVEPWMKIHFRELGRIISGASKAEHMAIRFRARDVVYATQLITRMNHFVLHAIHPDSSLAASYAVRKSGYTCDEARYSDALNYGGPRSITNTNTSNSDDSKVDPLHNSYMICGKIGAEEMERFGRLVRLRSRSASTPVRIISSCPFLMANVNNDCNSSFVDEHDTQLTQPSKNGHRFHLTLSSRASRCRTPKLSDIRSASMSGSSSKAVSTFASFQASLKARITCQGEVDGRSGDDEFCRRSFGGRRQSKDDARKAIERRLRLRAGS